MKFVGNEYIIWNEHTLEGINSTLNEDQTGGLENKLRENI